MRNLTGDATQVMAELMKGSPRLLFLKVVVGDFLTFPQLYFNREIASAQNASK